MTTVDRPTRRRRVYFHDLSAPAASLVVPSVFVVVRSLHGTLLLVRRCDSGAWELPGGRVDVGEAAVEAAVRETAEEAGVRVEVTGFAGLFTDPGHVVRASGGEVRQQFALLFRARAVGGRLAVISTRPATPRGSRWPTWRGCRWSRPCGSGSLRPRAGRAAVPRLTRRPSGRSAGWPAGARTT